MPDICYKAFFCDFSFCLLPLKTSSINTLYMWYHACTFVGLLPLFNNRPALLALLFCTMLAVKEPTLSYICYLLTNCCSVVVHLPHERNVIGLIPESDHVIHIPKTLQKWYQVLPCLAYKDRLGFIFL